MGSIWDWSTTASNNGASDSGINFAEGMAAAAVNNSARALMARVAELLADAGGTVASTGSSNAYLLTSTAAVTDYQDGLIVAFTANHTNNATATLNVRSLGAKTIYAHNAALVGGEIVSGGVYLCIYDAALNSSAGGWHLMNPKPVAALFPASSITSSATGNISSTNVQAALAELDTEKQPIDATLTALAGVTTAANKLIYATASDTFTTTDLSAFARTFIDDADAAAVRTTLGLVIGTNVQAYNALLLSIAGLSVVSGDLIYGSGTAAVSRLAKGSDGQYLTLSSGVPAWGYNSSAPDIIAEDQKASGTAGGSASATTTATRTLNTLVRNNGTLGSLSSNAITLPAGTYYAEWSAPGYRCDAVQTRLYNQTDSSVIGNGTSVFSESGSAVSTVTSEGSVTFTLAGSKAVRVEQYTRVARATDGLGVAATSGFGEVYARLAIWRIA